MRVSSNPSGRLITQRGRDGQRHNMITDYQGSVVAMLDTNGNLTARYQYGTYGQKATTTGPAADTNPFRYLGAYQLTNGLYQLGYRYYDPNWQRFTAPDPTGQENNPYAYAQGDPVNQSDPTGADSGCVLSFAGAVLTAPATLGGRLILVGAGVSALTAQVATLIKCF